MAAIDNIVNGEVNLPPGEHTKLFERIREVGKEYTVIGTNYTYNSRNQLVHRENLTRYEDYDYKYDDQGSMLTDSRSKYEWNALGQLTKVTFPDGFGEKYTYDMLGRRTSKTQFNHTGETQEVTNFTYKGDTWVITEEKNELGEVTKSYTFDANDRPLTITYKGETFWYVYNGHGDVMAMTDKDGNVAARYEYDAWGLVTRMYNRYGERIREGIGWIGDLGTGNGSPGSVQGPEDDSGNTVPDYHPGNGNGKAKGNGKGATEEAAIETTVSTELDSTEPPTDTLDLSAIVMEETEPTADITTDLVKENPFRYAGYYFDRKTQYYYLQARYYDPRPARFISEDTYEGEIENPQSLNMYVYVQNNPMTNIDPSGHYCVSANGEWAHEGHCKSNGYYLGDDGVFKGSPIIENGRLVKYLGNPFNVPVDVRVNYWISKYGRAITRATLMDIDDWSHLSSNNLTDVMILASKWKKYKSEKNYKKAVDLYVEAEKIRDKNLLEMADAVERQILTAQEEMELSGEAIEALNNIQFGSGGPNTGFSLGLSVKVKPDKGKYEDAKGHHIHSQEAFKGHLYYDSDLGFSISQQYMKENGWSHTDMTTAQRRLYKELKNSGRPNTMREHSRIAVAALVAGQVPRATARSFVAGSLLNLRAQYVRNPTKIPWYS